MINIIRADLYRIVRGKAVYITFAVMMLVVLLSVFVFRAMPSVTIAETEAMAHMNESSMPELPDAMNGAFAARMVMSSMETMVYFFLPLIIAVAMAMFSTGAVKNELSTGLDRTKLYFSKFVLSFALCVVFMLLYVFSTVLLATLLDGIGYWGDGLLLDLLKDFGALMPLVLAFNSVGMFFCFVTRRTAAVNGLYIALLLVPTIVVSLLSLAFPEAVRYFDYDLFNQFHILLPVSNLTATELARSFAVCLAFIVVPTLAGVGLFRRAEIK